MSSVFYEMLERYREDPVSWVRDIIGVQPDEWQQRVLEQIAFRTRRISVRSGHGVGKSACASWAMLFFLFHNFPCKIVCTSPSQSQLFDSLMAELKATIRMLPDALSDLLEVFSDRVVLKGAPSEAFISARTARNDESGVQALQGIHSENVLLVCDESSALSEAIFQSAGSSMSADHATMLLLGNPVRAQGYFYDTFHRLRDEWWTMKVSCEDSPRVSKEYISEMEKRYERSSNVFRVRILGEFPLSDSDTVIGLDLVEGAQERDVALQENEPILYGVDVARYGDDASAVCIRQGNQVLDECKLWRKLDLMQTTGRVMEMIDAGRAAGKPVDSVMVDSIGLGSAVVDRMAELGAPVVGINVSEAPSMGSSYLNLRAELWFKAREWLQGRDVRLPKDEKLAGELVLPKYQYGSNGKIRIESKEAMKQRAGISPDCADAFCLTFAGPALTASGRSSLWKQKTLVREIPGIV